MRSAPLLLGLPSLILFSLTVACGEDLPADGSGATGSGGAASGGAASGGAASGGAASGGTASGGTSGTGANSGSGGGSSAADHEASCVAFCTAYEAACSVSCPEICDGHANMYGEFCADFGVAYFDCMAALDPTTYDCESGNFKSVTDECEQEEDDVYVCGSLGGETCERYAPRDEQCSTENASSPFGFRCVSTVVPPDCSVLEGSIYCCPTE